MKQGLTLLLFCLIFHPAAAPNRHSRYDQGNGEGTRKGAVSVSGQPARPTQGTNGDQGAPKWYSPVWAEWGLVAVGLLTLLGVWKQARQTRRAADETAENVKGIRDQTGVLERQTKSIHHQAIQVRKQTDILKESADAAGRSAEAAKESARVALLNTEAVINNERPWIILECVQPERGYWDNAVLAPNYVAKPAYAVLHFRNFGNSPAWVFQSTAFLKICDDRTLEMSLDYGEPPPYPSGRPLPPGRAGHPLMISVFHEADHVLTPQEIRALEAGDAYLIVYGFLRYRDPFFEQTGKHRETWFCLRCTTLEALDGKILASWDYYGPKGANRHT